MPAALINLVRRLAPIAVVLGVLGGGVLTIDLILGRVFYQPHRWDKNVVTWHRVEEIGQRLAGYHDQVKAGETAPENSIAVIGSSSVWWDCHTDTLKANDPKNRTWLKLGAAGSRSSTIALHAPALFELGPPPAEIVIGINQIHFCTSTHERFNEVFPFEDRTLIGRLRILAREHSFIFNYTRSAPPPHRYAIYRLRLAIGKALGLPLTHLHAASHPPHRPAARTGTEKLPYEKQPRYQDYLEACSPKYFANTKTNPEVTELVRRISDLKERGAVVTLLLMPENSWHRSLFTGSENAFWNDFASLLSDDTRILDLRDSYPDPAFYDPLHLDLPNATKFSEILPAALSSAVTPKDWIATHPISSS